MNGANTMFCIQGYKSRMQNFEYVARYLLNLASSYIFKIVKKVFISGYDCPNKQGMDS